MKKGVLMIGMLVRIAFSLVVGVLIIYGVISLLTEMMDTSPEHIIARDLAVTINSLSAYQGSAYLKYPLNQDDLIIDIHDNYVTVRSPRDVVSSSINPLAGLRVEDASFSTVGSLPVRFDNKRVFFEDLDYDELTRFCQRIPGRFEEEETFRVTGTSLLKEQLEQSLQAQQKELVPGGASINIHFTIDSSFEGLMINYNSDVVKFNKLSCFINKNILSDHEDFNVERNPSNVRGLEIVVGEGVSVNNDFAFSLSSSITSALTEVLS